MTSSANNRELRPSYSFASWQRLRMVCVAWKQTEANVISLKATIEEKLQTTEKMRNRKSELQASQISLKLLRARLEKRRNAVRTSSARLTKLRLDLERRSAESETFASVCVPGMRDSLVDAQNLLSDLRDSLTRVLLQLVLRRQEMFRELSLLYSVVEYSNIPRCSCPSDRSLYSITFVHLPDAESYAGHSDDSTAIALGYVAHALVVSSRLLDVPLRYPMHFAGSRSHIEETHLKQPPAGSLSGGGDLANGATTSPASSRKFPLFAKGSQRIRFEYAVFLLNKNVAQLRWYAGLSTMDLRKTLANLRSFFERQVVGSNVDANLLMQGVRSPVGSDTRSDESGASYTFVDGSELLEGSEGSSLLTNER